MGAFDVGGRQPQRLANRRLLGEARGRNLPADRAGAGETGTVTFTYQNTGHATLYKTGATKTDCRGSNPTDRHSKWVDTSAPNAIGDQGFPIDQARVGPGQTFTCTIAIKAPSQYGVYHEYFAPVAENKGWMFNNGHDEVWAPLVSADATHNVWASSDYTASFIGENYPHSSLSAGQTGTVTFTYKNTGNATLYNTGTNPTDCRASSPVDRHSKWVDTSAPHAIGDQGFPIDQAKVGPVQTFTCTIAIKAPTTAGTSNEYFAPVTENKGWMFNNGHDDVWVPLTSSG